jgi:DNA repair protein RadC
LLHNHPSDTLKPLRDDIEATKEIPAAAEPLGITTITWRSAASFRSLGLMF